MTFSTDADDVPEVLEVMCDMGYCGIWISIRLTTKAGVAPDRPQALPISRVWREMHFCHISLGKFFYTRVSQVFETREMVQLHVSAVLMGETAEPSSSAGLVAYKFPPVGILRDSATEQNPFLPTRKRFVLLLGSMGHCSYRFCENVSSVFALSSLLKAKTKHVWYSVSAN